MKKALSIWGGTSQCIPKSPKKELSFQSLHKAGGLGALALVGPSPLLGGARGACGLPVLAKRPKPETLIPNPYALNL